MLLVFQRFQSDIELLGNRRKLAVQPELEFPGFHRVTWVTTKNAQYFKNQSFQPISYMECHGSSRHPDPTEQRQFFLAAGLTLGVAFWALVTIGMFVGGRLGGGLGLDITVPLCLVVSLGARVRARPAAVAAAIGALVIVVSGGWPSGTGMLVAIAAGAAGGLLVEAGRPR